MELSCKSVVICKENPDGTATDVARVYVTSDGRLRVALLVTNTCIGVGPYTTGYKWCPTHQQYEVDYELALNGQLIQV